jgi:hypothetical protein
MIVLTITIDDSQPAKDVQFSVMNTRRDGPQPNLVDLAQYTHIVEGRLLSALSMVPLGPEKPEEQGP